MKNNTLAIVVIGILAVGGYFVYKTKFWVKSQPFTKEQAIAVIVNSANSVNDKNVMATFEDQYLIDWANGVVNGQKVFTSLGKNYNVKGGKLTK